MVQISENHMKLKSTPVGTYQPNYNDIINMMNPDNIINYWPDPKFQHTRWNCGVDNILGTVGKYLDMHGKSYNTDGDETTRARIDDKALVCNTSINDGVLTMDINNTTTDNIGITLSPKTYDPGTGKEYRDIVSGDFIFSCTIESNTDTLLGTFGFSYTNMNSEIVTTSKNHNTIKHGVAIVNSTDCDFTIKNGIHNYTCRFPNTIDENHPISIGKRIIPTLTIVSTNGGHIIKISNLKLNKGVVIKHDKPYNELFNIPYMSIYKHGLGILDTSVPNRSDWVGDMDSPMTVFEEIGDGTDFDDLSDIAKELLSKKGWSSGSTINTVTAMTIYEISWDNSSSLGSIKVFNLCNITTIACDIYLVDGVVGMNGATNCKKGEWNVGIDYRIRVKEGGIDIPMVPMSTVGKIYIANFGVYRGVLTEEDILTIKHTEEEI